MAAPAFSTGTLLEAYRGTEMAAADAGTRYAHSRMRLEGRLGKAGMNAEDTETLFEAYERMYVPDFGASGVRLPGNDAARRLHDAATRAGVTPAEMQEFTASLRTQRQAEQRVNHVSRQLYLVGGDQLIGSARNDVEEMLDLRQQVTRIARRMNPEADIKTVAGLVENGNATGSARFDPLRRTVEVALDPTKFNPAQEAYRALWQSVSGLLSEREREVLAASLLGKNRDLDKSGVGPEKLAEAFTRWAAPDRAKHKGPIDTAFKPVINFFERVANAARGMGFQNAEDVWRRAERGSLAVRSQRDDIGGIRVPDRRKDPSAHDRVKQSLSSLTDVEVAKLLRDQKQAVDAARLQRQSALRAMTIYNPAVRGVKRVLSYFGPEGRDVLRDDDAKVRDLMRGLAVLEGERNQRARASVAQAHSMPDPGAPDPGIPSTADMIAAQAGKGTARVEGVKGVYTVEDGPARAPDGATYGMTVGLDSAQGPLKLGFVRDAAGAGAMIDAFERLVGEGQASPIARQLADVANISGKQDIEAIRKSGLLDERLDGLIGKRDAYAFVYPLKTGDLVFQDREAQWRAATPAEFSAYSLSVGDKHMQAAAEIISLDARRATIHNRDREGRAGGSEQSRPRPDQVPEERRQYLTVPPSEEIRAKSMGAKYDDRTQTFYVDTAEPRLVEATREWQGSVAAERRANERSDIAAAADKGVAAPAALAQSEQARHVDVRETSPAAALKVAARIETGEAQPVRLDPAMNPDQRRSAVMTMGDDLLKAAHKVTAQALADIRTALQRHLVETKERPAELLRGKLELSTGKTALEVELKARGLSIEQVGQKPKTRARSRDKGHSV